MTTEAVAGGLVRPLLIFTGVLVAGQAVLYGIGQTFPDFDMPSSFGLIIAMVVNIFLASPALQFAISAIGVLIFSGLTAYDTQKIKEMYFEGDDVLVAGRKAIMGALTLYLDFINLFTFLLQFLGNRE